VAFAISSFTSAGGVSGAILLLPFQMSVLGFTSPAVSATNQLFTSSRSRRASPATFVRADGVAADLVVSPAPCPAS